MKKVGISVNNLTKRFGDKVIYDNYEKSFEPGKIHYIKGKSGCGKTTLLNMIIGIDKDYEGEINFYFKGDLDDMTNTLTDANELINRQYIPRKSVKFSVVFQEDRLCEQFSVLDNVTLSKGVDKNDVINTLKALGLKECIHQKVSQLSGGMKRRVAIARALVSDCDVFVADEPYKGLDEQTMNMVKTYLEQKVKEKTVIMVSHERD